MRPDKFMRKQDRERVQQFAPPPREPNPYRISEADLRDLHAYMLDAMRDVIARRFAARVAEPEPEPEPEPETVPEDIPDTPVVPVFDDEVLL